MARPTRKPSASECNGFRVHMDQLLLLTWYRRGTQRVPETRTTLLLTVVAGSASSEDLVDPGGVIALEGGGLGEAMLCEVTYVGEVGLSVSGYLFGEESGVQHKKKRRIPFGLATGSRKKNAEIPSAWPRGLSVKDEMSRVGSGVK